MVDDLVHRPVVVRASHVPEVLVQLVDAAAVPAEHEIGGSVDVGGEEDHRNGAVVVEVGRQCQYLLGKVLHGAVRVVGPHGP